MYRLMKLNVDLQRVRAHHNSRIGQRDLLNRQREDAQKRYTDAVKDLGHFDLVQILLEKTSNFAREQSKSRIESIVTSALTVVFGSDYRFTIGLDTKGNQPIAAYFITHDGVTTQLKPPDYDNGGGIVDVVSLALRLAVGELVGLKGPLFLDEIGKMVSAEYAPAVGYFLREYSYQFNRQMILITHNTALAEIGDNSISVRKVNGGSCVSGL